MNPWIVVSADDVTIVSPEPRVPQLETFDFAVAAHEGNDGRVRFVRPGRARRRAAATEASRGTPGLTVTGLGERIVSSVDDDLSAFLLTGFFDSILEQLRAPRSGHAPCALHAPPWIGPRHRQLIREAALAVGIEVEDGCYRGLLPALAEVAQSPDRARSGGWITADRSGDDFDLYAVEDQSGSKPRRLALCGYRRCRALFSAYYRTRQREAIGIAAAALDSLPSEWDRLATHRSAARLLDLATQSLGRQGPPVETLTLLQAFARIRAATSLRPDVEVTAQWRFWLDHGDERLTALTPVCWSVPLKVERLLELPAEPPARLFVGLRAGFGPQRYETQEVCRLELTRPEHFFARPGWVLVRVEMFQQDSGTLAAEVVQPGSDGRTTARAFTVGPVPGSTPCGSD